MGFHYAKRFSIQNELDTNEKTNGIYAFAKNKKFSHILMSVKTKNGKIKEYNRHTLPKWTDTRNMIKKGADCKIIGYVKGSDDAIIFLSFKDELANEDRMTFHLNKKGTKINKIVKEVCETWVKYNKLGVNNE